CISHSAMKRDGKSRGHQKTWCHFSSGAYISIHPSPNSVLPGPSMTQSCISASLAKLFSYKSAPLSSEEVCAVQLSEISEIRRNLQVVAQGLEGELECRFKCMLECRLNASLNAG